MITTAEIKAHLRVTHDAEDALIAAYAEAALTHIAEYLGEDMPDPMPAPIKAAVLLLTADLYVHRERQIDRPIHHNTAYQLLLNPYRSMEVLP